jgi:DNA processing protein
MLLQAVEYPAEVFTLKPAELKSISNFGPVLANAIAEFDGWEEINSLLQRTKKIGAEIITYYDETYPPRLREIYDPPMLLWVKGDAAALKMPGVAVVGTRRASKYGVKQSGKFSRQLAEAGLVIVSGLAYGVDAAAHQSTLNAGGKTIAVLGSGIDNVYPFKHKGLANAIVKNSGAVITEFPPGAAPDAGNFPLRNRIISGLTLGTLVAESGLKGGSMITAQSALTQNREVFVVPHSLGRATGEGCNHLIKRAAGKLVQNMDDIIEELPLQPQLNENLVEESEKSQKKRWQSLELDDEGRTICALLQEKPMHIDDLSEELETASHKLLPKLLELEMQHCIRQTAGKNFELY